MPHPDHEKNREAWNELVGVHIDHSEYRTREVIEGGSSLKWIEKEALGNVAGKHLLHLQCQFGLDTFSWARRGAIVTGVDISDESIKRANEIKVKAGLEDTEFVRCDVLDLIGVIDKKFDIVFQSYGTHCWISDIYRWADVVAHYLKPGGIFFIVDDHPIKVIFYDPPLNYFDTEPEYTPNAPDYCDTEYRIKGELVEWQHPLSEIINALIEAGLVIEHVGEYNFGYYKEGEGWTERDDRYWLPPGGLSPYPLMMSIKAHLPE
jgi:SAM-dependent methyltransferase